MALAPADERNLIFPLFAGLQQAEGWDAFLKRLLPRTGATRICLLQRPSGSKAMHAFQREVWTGRQPPDHPLDITALEQSGLMPLQSLRPERVYALDEMRVTTDQKSAARQNKIMTREGIAHARFVRFTPGTDAVAWLIIVHDRKDFGAADSALMSAVIPYLAVAIATLTQILTLQLRASIAEEALAMLGVGQIAFDRQGRAIVADAIGEAELDVQPGSRPPLRSTSAEALAATCNELADKPASTRRLLRIDDRKAGDILLRPASRVGENLPRVAAATGLVRRATRESEASAARIVAARFGLSAREAALAVALSRGHSLIDAGEQLQLTRETARNYSKRIYAKTGASGQADLVRMILTDLTPFA